MQKISISKYIFANRHALWLIKENKRDNNLWPKPKNWYHLRLLTINPWGGRRQKEFSIKYQRHRSSSGLTLPHHQLVHASSVMSCHVMSWVIIGHIIIVDHVYSKCIVKWKSKGHTWNIKSHVSWKVIESQTIMRVVKYSQGGWSITPWLYIHPHYIRKGFFTLGAPTRN